MSFNSVKNNISWAIMVTSIVENWQDLIQKIKAAGMRPGVALKPGTPIEQVFPLVSVNITTLRILSK